MSNDTVRIRPKVSSASGRREGWAKHVVDVNSEHKNGYAFIGDFLSPGVETDLPVGAIVLFVDPQGSVKNWWKSARICKLNHDATFTRLNEEALDWRDDFMSIRDSVVDALKNDDASQSGESVEDILSDIADDDLMIEAKRRGLA